MEEKGLEKIIELAISRGYLRVEHLKSIIEMELCEQETITSGNEGRDSNYLLSYLEKLKKSTDDEGQKETVLTPNIKSNPLSSLPRVVGKEFSDLTVGEKYKLVKMLGSGGMGSVYLAEDLKLNRRLALKFLNFEKESTLLRFMQEARSQARVHHPNVCTVYEVGQVDGRSYIAMEYIDGQSLKDVDSLRLEQKVEIIKVCAEALQAAHSLGIIHRDIKPANIMVEKREDGSLRPVVMDFGLARESDGPEGLTESNAVMGTPAYMSPEQAQGDIKLLDRRTDIYSLGATLYELVTGSPPFTGETVMTVLMSVIKDDPRPPRVLVPQLPRDLEAIILKCLEKEPRRRYDSAAALALDLQRFLDGKPIEAVQKTFRYRAEKFLKRYRSVVILSFIVFLIIVTSGGFALRSELRIRKQLQIAQQFALEVNELDFLTQRAYLLPLHDISSELRQIAHRLKKIEVRIAELGDVAYAPGYYALARGHFILKNNQKALEYIEKAQAVGNLEPETYYYKGLILSGIYNDKLKQASALAKKNEREAMKDALKREFIPQIEQCLTRYLQSGRTEQSVEYVEGLLNFYQEKFEQALECTERAIKKYPWFYKASVAKAEILKGMQEQAFLKGEYERAVDNLKKAMEALAEAEKVGRSDPSVYTAQIENIQSYFVLKKNKRLEPEIYRDALAVYEKAIKANPQNTEARIAMAHICKNFASMVYKNGQDPSEYYDFALKILNEAGEEVDVLIAAGQVHMDIADYNYYRGLDIRGECQKAEAYFKKVLESEPGNSLVLRQLGYLYITKYDYEVRKGLDVGNSFQNAAHYLKLSLEQAPNHHIIYTNLGYIYEREATRLAYAGLDPGNLFQAARENYLKSLELNPRNVVANNNVGVLLVRTAEYEIARGRNPEPYLKEAEEYFLKAVACESEYPNSYNNLSYLYRIRAEMELWEDRSPHQYLDKAIEQARRAVTISPTYSQAWSNLGNAYIVRLEYELKQRRVETNSAAESRAHLEMALKEDPDSFISYQRLARLDLLLARQALLLKKAPEKYFQRALEELEQALKLNPKFTNTYLLGVEICFRWGVYMHSQKRSSEAQEKRAEELLTKARTLTSENADLLAAQAEVYYLQSLKESGQESLKKALEALEQSTQLNRWCKKRNEFLAAEMNLR